MDATDDMSYLQYLAVFVAIVIRNAMEDFHHEHLSDEQMKELNPIIRNAIYTALHAQEQGAKGSKAAISFIEYSARMVPAYWEKPELLEDYTQLQK